MEFLTAHEPFHKLRKVSYVDEMPKIDPVSAILEDNYDQFVELFCTKSKSWEYEQEWRAIHKKSGIVFTYPAESLRGIYFGPDIEKEALEIICLIIQGQNPNVKFWRGIRSEEHFEVRFDQFSYTSHCDSLKANNS